MNLFWYLHRWSPVEQEKYEFPEGLKSSNSGGSGVSIEDLNLVMVTEDSS